MIRRIENKTLAVVVCNTCASIVGEIGSSSMTSHLAMIEARKHTGHQLITLDRWKKNGESKYSERQGFHPKPNLLM